MANGRKHQSEGGPEDPQGEPGSGSSRQLSRHNARAYQYAMEAAFSIPIAGGLGWWADSSFGTAPAGLLVGLVLGFAACVLRLVRMRALVEEASAEAAEEEDS